MSGVDRFSAQNVCAGVVVRKLLHKFGHFYSQFFGFFDLHTCAEHQQPVHHVVQVFDHEFSPDRIAQVGLGNASVEWPAGYTFFIESGYDFRHAMVAVEHARKIFL